MKENKKYISKEGFPTRQGVYLAIGGTLGSPGKPEEIDVYRHPIKGLCVFSGDYGADASTFGVNDKTDCHVPVGNTGLEFITWEGNIKIKR